MKKTYARRPLRRLLDTGVRPVASTYGKRSFATYSNKSDGLVGPESQAERIVSHLLTIDPSVTSFVTQPFTVDIVERRILRTKEDVAQAVARHRYRVRDAFYTPDFEIVRNGRVVEALEVKLESFEGDFHYKAKLSDAAAALRGFGYRLRTLVLPVNRTHPIYANAQLLRLAALRRDLAVDAQVLAALLAAQETGATTLGEFAKALNLPAGLMPVLIVRGGLAARLLKYPLNGATPAWTAHGDLGHLELMGELEQ